MLFEVSLPRELYRNGSIDQRYHQTVKRGRGSDKVYVEAPTPLAAFSTVLAGQHHGVLTKLSGRIFFKDLLGIPQDADVSGISREEKERLLAAKRYVKPAPQGARVDYVFEGSGGDRAEITPNAMAASRGEAYQPFRPVRSIGPEKIDISPEAREVARILADKPLTPEEENRRARIAQAISDYTQGKRAQGIFTPAQDEEVQRLRIKEMRDRQAERGDQPRKLTYFGEDEKLKNVPPTKPVQPKPVQGTFWDLRPPEYLGERLDTSG